MINPFYILNPTVSDLLVLEFILLAQYS